MSFRSNRQHRCRAALEQVHKVQHVGFTVRRPINHQCRQTNTSTTSSSMIAASTVKENIPVTGTCTKSTQGATYRLHSTASNQPPKQANKYQQNKQQHDISINCKGGMYLGWKDVPDGDAMAPPELPADAPVTNPLQPHIVDLLKAIWHDAQVTIAHCLQPSGTSQPILSTLFKPRWDHSAGAHVQL